MMMSDGTGSYREFVKARFLRRNEGAEGLMHAAVGVLGEVLEMRDATSWENLIEECGDIEFYLEAAFIVLRGEADPQAEYTPLGPRLDDILTRATLFHDRAKKYWVYSKPIDRVEELRRLSCLARALGEFYAIRGLSTGTVRYANMEKLTKRYPVAYTDELAEARLDKAGDPA
jgi:hypothetical protein